MTYSADFLSQQKERLLTEKKRIEGGLKSIAKKDPVVPDDYDATFPQYGRDPEENAQEEERYEARLGIEGSLELHLRDVNNALVQLEQGTYGTCSKCGEKIDEERLRAFPAAKTCTKHG